MIQWIHKLGETIFGNDENLIKNDCKYSIKNEKKKQNLAKSLIILIKNGSRKNTCLIVSALICALIGGIFQPVVLLIGGWMTDIFLKNGTKIQNDQFLDSVFILIYYGCGCGIFVFILAFLQGIFIQRGTRGLIDKIRKEYLNAVLQQDSNWLDNNPSGIITNNLNENIEIISDGLGNKLCMLIRGFSMFLSSIIACSFINWQLTFITFTMGPISAFVLHFLSKVNETANEEMMENSAKTNSIFEESILNIRTVQACNGQQFMISKLSKINEIMKKLYMKTTFWAGFFDGLSLFVVYLITGISLLFGCRLYFEGEIKNAGDVILIVNTVCVTGYFLGLLGPHLSSLHQATQSFSILHELIQNCSFIEENQNEKNEKSISGHIIFKNVRFKYSNRDEEILKGLSFEVLPGQTIALVGISGCGKSTSIGLLTKMYRATEGEILIDGQNIDNLNSRKLRKNIGIVQQEPKLFDGTINENIQLGRNIDEQNFQKSLKIANIFEFTSKLKNGIETRLGSGGIQLSGGEKQRICISRALVTSPSILILDEATSALDSQNEQIVNKALSNASIGRTTIIIAHRLSSLKNVDRIFVIDEGITKEIGNHYELMKKGGIYAKLAKRQEIEQNTNKNWERKQEIEVEKLRKSIGTIEPFEGSAATILQEYDVHFVGLSTSNSNSDEAENEKITKNGFFKLIRNAMKHSKMFFLVTFLSIPRSIELFTYGLGLSLAFNTLQKSKENYMTWAILTLAEQTIAGIVVWILHTLLIYFCGWIANETINELKIEIFEKVLNQPISFFDNPNTSPSKCVSKIIKHSHHLFACLDHRAIRLLFINGTFFALLLAFPFVWELGSLGLIITIILTILTCFFQISAHRAHNQKSFNDKSRQFSIEIIENIRTIKLMAVEHFFQIKFENFMKLAEAYENKIGKLSAINFALNQSYVFASDMILFYFGALLIYHGKYSPDKIFLAFNGAQMSAWGVLYYSSWMPEVIRGSASADHFFSFFYSMSEAKETKLKKPQINGSIKIENVSFSYPSTPNINICDRFSIEVPIGNSIGLVGSSGCGKSTIISLLEKFYSPKSGKIKIDNIDINEIDSYHLHQNIALVGQEPILFNATIYENITIGLENVDINEVIKSCEIANSLNFIKNFPLGFDTIVGEGGGFLSGGQKQRIAIARALVRNPKIILFDEATSALDSESEEAVQNALKLATKDRTSITIAHRLGTIQHCDKIYFISNGKIIESGTHLELLQLNQKYAAFVSAQNI